MTDPTGLAIERPAVIFLAAAAAADAAATPALPEPPATRLIVTAVQPEQSRKK